MNKKKILAIILVLLVILLGGASVYVATQLSIRKSVVPTVPESKPEAFETCGTGLYCSSTQPSGASQCTDTSANVVWCCPLGKTIKNGVCVDLQWVGSEACTATGSATAAVCVPSGVITCASDCPTACGIAASTITTCTDSCGGATTKACAATAACGVDGGWSEWDACSATACGTSGTMTRTCNDPAPSAGRAECTRTNGSLTTPSNRVESATCSAGTCDCVPNGTKTCSPDCPTACGRAASTITCTDSCGGATTKACAATVACATGTISPTITKTITPTVTEVTAKATPTILPETGIFDLPGVVAFGGGLLLAVIGILLAL